MGSDAMYLEFADVWRKRISEIVSNGKRFNDLMKNADVLYIMNGATEEHTFMVQLPESLSPDDVQFLADEILNVARTYEHPFVTLNDEREKCQVIFTTEKEPEILGLDKAEGISAGAVFQPIIEGWGGKGRQEPFM